MTSSTPMTARRRSDRFGRLLGGASALAVAIFAPTVADAQLIRQRAAAGTVNVGVIAPPRSTTTIRPANMREAIARRQALTTRAEQLRGLVTSARDAALAATRANPTDGIGVNGLAPIATIAEAARLAALGGAANLATAETLRLSVSATRDATGANTWEGASVPRQAVEGGRTTVTIDQTQQRALLSWNRFDIGANTTLQFNQRVGGAAQPGWTVVNRVPDAVAPSTILGSLRADGQVFVLNRNGVIFGQSAQVNLQSLLASSLDLGNFSRDYLETGDAQNFQATTLRDRTANFLSNGLFTAPPPEIAPTLLVSSLFAPGRYRTVDAVPQPLEGAVTVDAGARVSGGDGGFVILAAPVVTNAGTLTATNGQVSLQAGRFIGVQTSTGAATSIDPDVRGLVLSTVQNGFVNNAPRAAIPDDGVVRNTGLIQSDRGYLSLGASAFGAITNTGLLGATTSVSRNGKISLTGGIVTLAPSSGISILPDANGETIPQGTADNPPGFKTSQIEIGARFRSFLPTEGLPEFVPNRFAMGQGAFILAPSADIVIGRAAATPFNRDILLPSSIDLAGGALIDVAGVQDVALAASRNSVVISPVKRNELRDTPTYREPTTDGSFTLNGQTLIVDARRSGVRDDGVAWVGSPLLEAASLVSQIPVTAAELMTTGGNVALGVGLVTTPGAAADAPAIRIAPGALIDVSGGWVSYQPGAVRTSQLIAGDGRIVDIGDADRNDDFVAVVNGFTESQPRFGVTDIFRTAVLQGERVEQGYDEGRDAGSLTIGASAIGLDGSVFGNAFAGFNQLAGARRPGLRGTIAADPRLLQRSTAELPAGGYLRLGSATGAAQIDLGADILIHAGARTGTVADPSETLLSDAMLSNAGLGALVLQTSGRVRFGGVGTAARQSGLLASGGKSRLTLADGGVLAIDAGRAIEFAGDVRAASGAITARTYEFQNIIGANAASGIGNPFAADDDLSLVYTADAFAAAERPRNPFDITVGGTLSAAGRFANDLIADDSTGERALGSAFIDGGSVTLAVAPKVLVAIGESLTEAQVAGDLSGSIRVVSGGRIDVSAGALVAANRTLDLTGRGGDVSLINETTYAGTVRTTQQTGEEPGASDQPLRGTNQTVQFTPVIPDAADVGQVVPSLVPVDRVATVRFAPGSITGFGFAAGGTFRLVAPDIAFGSDTTSVLSTLLPLDFAQRTGFGALDLTSFRSRVVGPVFDNGRTGPSAFFETTQIRVRAGETLDLTQSFLPSILDQSRVNALFALAGDGDSRSVLTPSVPSIAFDRRAVDLTLRGLTELVVDTGGLITGAPEARITVPALFNAGSIVLPGATVTQAASLPIVLSRFGVGLRDPDTGGTGLAQVFGPANANGLFDENAANAIGVTDADGNLLTNRQLLTTTDNERALFFLGQVDGDTGIRIAPGGVIDVAGIALLDPRAPFRQDGTQLRFGRLIAGGTVSTGSALTAIPSRLLFSQPTFGNVRAIDASDPNPTPTQAETPGRRLVASPGARIDIGGASAIFDQAVSATAFAPFAQWSDAGRLALLAGGTLAGAGIDARGGAAQAAGGTLEWLRPVVRATAGVADGENVVAADQVAASGFDTLRARGGLTLSGDVALTLGKSLLVDSADPLVQGALVGTDAFVTVGATAGASAAIAAPYIRFASRLGTTPFLTGTVGDAAVSFTATASGIDLAGGILFDSSIASLRLATLADIRLIGVDDRANAQSGLPALNGQLVAGGDLTLDAGRVFATTGTGNLQRFLEAARLPDADPRRAPLLGFGNLRPYQISVLNGSSVTIAGGGVDVAAPLTAGTYLRINAAEVIQDGHLAAPLGRIEIGTSALPVDRIAFGAGSITSVSGAGLNIPYGSTTDLTEFFFTPGLALPITATPVGELRLTGQDIAVEAGATLDTRGGGDLFGFEFVSGTGGSRDVLDRFNRDAFSSNAFDPVSGVGLQFPDGRQVFSILPVAAAGQIAGFDPIYSADYGATGPVDLYGAQAGRRVTLDGAGGVPAGEYLVLPGRYGLLPGALRLVENTDSDAPGLGQVLRDGSVITSGVFSTAGTDIVESRRRSFTVQPQSSFLRYSQIETTSATAAVVRAATERGRVLPRLPLDAARVVLSPQGSLRVSGALLADPAPGGRNGQVDITAATIFLAPEGTAETPGALTLTDVTLGRLRTGSLMIGAERTDRDDETTLLGVTATDITVRSGFSLDVPELVLAVGGGRSEIVVEDGVTLRATGSLLDGRAGDYVVQSFLVPPIGYPFDSTGIGSLLRLANGPERLVRREGELAARLSTRPSRVQIRAATLQGATLTLDSSRQFAIFPDAMLDVPLIALSGDRIGFGAAFGLDAGAEAQLAGARRLTLRSPGVIGFDAGARRFNDLTLDAPGIALVVAEGGAIGDVAIEAGAVRIQNSSAGLGQCGTTGLAVCGLRTPSLSIAAFSLTFGTGAVRTYGFDGGVTLTGAQGSYVTGEGSFTTGIAALTLETPFLIDRARIVDPTRAPLIPSDAITATNFTIPELPDYAFLTGRTVELRNPGGVAVTPAGLRAPGARIAFGSGDDPVAALTIDGVAVTATAGVIDARSRGTIALTGGASLATPSYTRTFGDEQSRTTFTAGGGTVNLVSLGTATVRPGDIQLAAGTRIVVDDGVGAGGSLNLLAGRGAITLGAELNPGVTGARDADFRFDAGTSAFDLDAFVVRYGRRFGGDLSIRSGAGNLSLGVGRMIEATSVRLTADGGVTSIFGRIDTAGDDLTGLTGDALRLARVNGGAIGLFARDGVALFGGAVLDTHTNGYIDADTRQARSGDVTIGVSGPRAAISILPGSTIDVGARRTQAADAVGENGNRLVPEFVRDPDTLAETTAYRFAEADLRGTVTFRAPTQGAADELVDVRLGGRVTGAREVQIEAFKRFDLRAFTFGIDFPGITRRGGFNVLDLSDTGVIDGLRNPLTENFVTAGGQRSVVNFIREFDVAALDGGALTGVRVRPGVEIFSHVGLRLGSDWNLAAATIDLEAAAAAGLLAVIPELGLRVDGTPYYRVLPGAEGALLMPAYADFTYRVGGSIMGETAALTLRAARDLVIDGSISDGFFTFRDKSDPAYISYQLGGGNRVIDPAVGIGCFTGDCGDVATFTDTPEGSLPDNFVEIALNRIVAGNPVSARFVNSPLSIAGNGPAALGVGFDRQRRQAFGGPSSFAELFPLLPDGSAIGSADIRLVAGAGTAPSSDPGRVDLATGATLTVERGDSRYLVAPIAGISTFGTSLQLRGPGSPAETPAIDLRDLIRDAAAEDESFDPLVRDSFTVVNWGASQSGVAADARAFAERFFDRRGPATFITPGRVTTGVAAPLVQVLAFLRSFTPTLLDGVAQGLPGYPTGPGGARPLDFGPAGATGRAEAQPTNVVRTGTGGITVTAAGDLDLSGGAPVYRTERGITVDPRAFGAAQIGGAAVYTAGRRLDARPVTARVIGGGLLSVTPDAAVLDTATEQLDFLPSPKGLSDVAAVLATGGGSISVSAGDDVLGRRDVFGERFLGTGRSARGGEVSTFVADQIGSGSQRWRPGLVGLDTEIGIAPRYFTSGIAALGGGDVRIGAGGDVNELTVALTSSVTTTLGLAGRSMLTFGGGDLDLTVGGSIGAGQFDLAHGVGRVRVDGDVRGFGVEAIPASPNGDLTQYPRLRVADAETVITGKRDVALASITSLGASRTDTVSGRQDVDGQFSAGFFSPRAGLDVAASGRVLVANNREAQLSVLTSVDNVGVATGELGVVLPPSLRLAALTGDLAITGQLTGGYAPSVMYPSAMGQLQLFSAGDLDRLVIAMLDSEPSFLPGPLSVASVIAGSGNTFTGEVGLPFGFPVVNPTTTDATLRLQHNPRTTHAGDPRAVQIEAASDLTDSVVYLPKQARIGAGRDILNLFFVGQNIAASDATRISAGRNILGEIDSAPSLGELPYIASTDFQLGGPGLLSIEAGRNLGPFVNSATLATGFSFAGGVQTVGNDYNPWFSSRGSDIRLLFGTANGTDYLGLRETYLNPANFDRLDGDLFVQIVDTFGNARPDRSRPIYAPILATWLRENAPDRFSSVFAGQDVGTDAALATAAYARTTELYRAFIGIDAGIGGAAVPLRQQNFLIDQLLFGELAQPALPDSPSFLQYVRGYRAVEALFPTARGYTNNLAPYTTDPATVDADNPLGVPTRNIVNGQPQSADRVRTGAVDLRLATVQTVRGGDVTILGPGGDFVAGSVVRTSEQARNRATPFGFIESRLNLGRQVNPIATIPIGFEGVLTLRGGAVRGLTDGDFRVNQSRLFTQAGGDILLWSSNGDLNAGQGPRSASNFPPITVRFDPLGAAEVDSAGSVAGAGIGAFQRTPADPPSDVLLLAPVGEVDAGDAGVRASGDIFVAAARVANADNFSAGGDISGVPSGAAATVAVAPADAASAIVAQAARAAEAVGATSERRSVISVDVLGYVGGRDPCEDPDSDDPQCRTRPAGQ